MRAIDRPVGDVWMQSIEEILNEWTSVDGGEPGDWAWLLDEKRTDDHYPQVLASIRDKGFTRPVTCDQTEWADGDVCMNYGDGHHRLAVAIDLGMTHIPMVKCGYWGDVAHSYNLDRGEYAGTSDKFRELISTQEKVA